jgi:protein-tyrosine phosphatase
MMKILMVCLGNICRSPIAQAVMEKLVAEQELNIEVDSAGTAGYHIGKSPDPRSIAVGEAHHYSFNGQQCRQVSLQDFEVFDLILAMDESNLRDLQSRCPEPLQGKLALLLSYTPDEINQVPDPYYGEEDGFVNVLRLVEQGCEGVLNSLNLASH